MEVVHSLLPHLKNYLDTLLNDYRVQEMIKDVGVSAGQFLLNNIFNIIMSRGDVNRFLRRAGRRKAGNLSPHIAIPGS